MALFRRRTKRQAAPALHFYRGEGKLHGEPRLSQGLRRSEQLLLKFKVVTNHWGLLTISLGLVPEGPPGYRYARIERHNYRSPMEEWSQDARNSPPTWVEAAYLRGLDVFASLMRTSAQARAVVEEFLAPPAPGHAAAPPASGDLAGQAARL